MGIDYAPRHWKCGHATLYDYIARVLEPVDCDGGTMNVRVTLVSELAVNYFDLRAAQQRYAIAVRNLAAQRRTLDVTRQRKLGGFVSGLDLANAEAQVASTEAQLPQLELSARTAAFDIALLLGREPGALSSQLLVVGSIPPVPPVVPAGLPSDLLRRYICV